MKQLICGWILVWAVCLFSVGASFSAEIYGASIVDYGIYAKKDVETRKAGYGTYAATTPERLIQHTDSIPAIIGTTFGYRYTINGAPKGGHVDLTVKIIIPQPGLTNPKTGKTFHELAISYKNLKIGSMHHELVTFEEEWDLIPGQWHIQVWHEGTRLIDKAFTVYVP